MLKGKLERLFRRIRRGLRSALLLWLPAGIVVLLLGIVFFFVIFSKDESFHVCARQLPVCMGEDPGALKVLGCSYQTAWCDIQVIWNKAAGKAAVSDLPDLPPVDEKAEKELFEKLTSDEFLEKRFEELEKEEKNEAFERKNLEKFMEKLRAERISFEKEMTEKREKMLSEQPRNDPEENNLSGQTGK